MNDFPRWLKKALNNLRSRQARPPTQVARRRRRHAFLRLEELENRVTPSVPTVSAVSPDKAQAGGSMTACNITGTNFVSVQHVYFGAAAATGIISGAVEDFDSFASAYSVTVTATDSTNAAVGASQSFQWTVRPLVTLASPGSQTNAEGDTVYVGLLAADSGSNTLTFTASGLPSGLSIDAGSGWISGTIASGAHASSPYSVTVTATDSVDTSASASQTFNWTVNASGTVTVTLVGPGNQTNSEEDVVDLSVSATDSANSLTYSATNLPPGLSIGTTTGLISGTITDGASLTSPYSVTIQVADSVNPSIGAGHTFLWVISPAVSIDDPGNQESGVGDIVSLPVSGSDSAANPLTFSASGLPTGLTIDPASGVISGTIASNADLGSPYSVSVTATDPFDDTASAVQTFDWIVSSSPSLSGTVWNDENGNGTQDSGEVGVASVTVTLYTSTGSAVASATTDSQGSYHFDSVSPATYYLALGSPTGFVYGASDSGGQSGSFAISSGTPATENLPLVWNAGLKAIDDYFSDPDYQTTDDSALLAISKPGILANDLGVTSSVTITVLTTTAYGSLTVYSDGSFTYLPNGPKADYPGSDSFVYQLSNGTATSTATVYLSVDEPYGIPHKDNGPIRPVPANATVIQDAGRFVFDPDSIVFVSDNTGLGDSVAIWWNGGSPRHTGIGNWTALVDILRGLPDGRLANIYISGHGSTAGGIATADGVHLTADSLTADEAALIKRKLSASARIILLGCESGGFAATGRIATMVGVPVVANTGDINTGNYGFGPWVQFNP